MGIDHAGLDNALAHRGRHTELKDKNCNQVKGGRKYNRLSGFKHPGGHHRRDRIGRIMKAIHEVEGNGQKNQHGHDPKGRLYALHD